MSIDKLENIARNYVMDTQYEDKEYIDDIYRFMLQVINTFKEDKIDVSEIKEVQNLNGYETSDRVFSWD